MTSEDRARVREAVDAYRRAHITRAPYAYACARCGIDRSLYRPGCETCQRRRRNKEKK